MRVRSLGWLGVRTKAFSAMCDFYRDVLELEVLQSDAKAARFKLADGTEAHVYSNEDTDHAYFGTGPVVGFAVESFSATRAAMLESGMEFLYPDPQREDGRAWQHFRAPDGNIYEIIGPDDIDVTSSDGGIES